MDFCSEEAIKRYNEDKLKKLRSEVERSRKIAKSCEIKEPIKNNGYHFCEFEYECWKKRIIESEK